MLLLRSNLFIQHRSQTLSPAAVTQSRTSAVSRPTAGASEVGSAGRSLLAPSSSSRPRGSAPQAAAGPSSGEAVSEPTSGAMEVATLGGGCFWCIEACYNMLRGVRSAVSGYAAGHIKNPTYKQVCSGTTGHAEVVQITYDPSVLSYREILEIFFTIHDPTTKDRQGNDTGPQYRSIILTHGEQQRQVAQQVMQQVESEGWWGAPLVTEVQPLDLFYPAEDYHQNYFVQNPGQGYCRVVVGPKVAKFRAKFGSKMK
ncbi:hypothetical protein Agub_g15253 [Astrephomene gubernaculifera]|uniref:peptide-methionine (S)-S-oxide reductase n=1 Tax=Astrephomene gubernaculifera TaxID=47775 RepID=A0AAD3E580_9CHLO|nr:hypothetical protein Agub_g15253 [Astrephomene gubernaculifera]